MTDTFNISAFNIEQQPDKYALNCNFGDRATVSFGASKVIARFVQLLLTLKGSDKTDPNAGCNLISLVANLHTSETSYLRSEVNSILADPASLTRKHFQQLLYAAAIRARRSFERGN